MKPNKEKIERLRSYLIHIHGNELGIKRCGNLLRASSLKVLTFKYGKENGTKRYKEIKNKQKGKGTLEFYINRYGKDEGTKKYKEKNLKLSVSPEALKRNGFSDDEIKNIRHAHAKKSSTSLQSFIDKYGETEGKHRYDLKMKSHVSQWTIEYWLNKGLSVEDAKKKISEIQTYDLKKYIKKYGEHEGKRRYIEFCRKKGLTKEQLVKKYGTEKADKICKSKAVTYDYLVEKFGAERANIIQNKRLHNFHGISKIQKKFASELFNCITLENEKFYGEPVSRPFFINLTNEERQILDQKVIIPDIVIGRRILIEFDGTYWHSFTKERDRLKDIIYKKRGFLVIRVKENDYKNNKENILQKIKKIIENENQIIQEK